MTLGFMMTILVDTDLTIRLIDDLICRHVNNLTLKLNYDLIHLHDNDQSDSIMT